MLKIEEIREKLSDRQLRVVADRIGIHENTLYRIMSGKTANYTTIEKLSEYLEKPAATE